MFELFRLTQILHYLLDIRLLELEGLVAGVNLHFQVFNVLDELENLLIFIFKVDVELDDNVLESVLLVDQLLRCGHARVVKSPICTHGEGGGASLAHCLQVVLRTTGSHGSCLFSLLAQTRLRLVYLGAAESGNFQLVPFHLTHALLSYHFVLVDFNLELFSGGDSHTFRPLL